MPRVNTATRPVAANLEFVSYTGDAELVLVQLVDEHVVGELQVARPSLDHVPRSAERLIRIEADNLNALLPAVAALPLREPHDVFGRVRDARRREDRRQLAVGIRNAHLDVGHARGRDPEVRPRVVDQARRRRREPEEQSELHDDEHDGEHDAGDGDEEAHPVVNQIAPGELGDSGPHVLYTVLLRNSVK